MMNVYAIVDDFDGRPISQADCCLYGESSFQIDIDSPWLKIKGIMNDLREAYSELDSGRDVSDSMLKTERHFKINRLIPGTYDRPMSINALLPDSDCFVNCRNTQNK
jgi:hypothetical protein